jgi:hypothetical protein
MIVTNPKKNIPKLIKNLQQRLREHSKAMTQEEIAYKLYPPTGSDNPKERYIKRFIQRSASTRFDIKEIVRLVEIFQAVIEPIEAILLVVWSQVEANKDSKDPLENTDPVEQIREQFSIENFEEALSLYKHRTNFDDILPTTRHNKDSKEKKYIPLHKLSMSTDEIDLGQLVGIDVLVQRIVKSITRENGSRFISVEGQGGIGKTSIAFAVIEQIRRDTNFKAVIWISVGGYLSLATFELGNQGYESILSQVGKIFTLPDESSVLNLLENEPYLVVIDNIETKQEAEGGLLNGLVSLTQGKSRFLITSRFAMRSHFSFINSIELKELSIHNVQKLLESLFEGKEKITTQKAARIKSIVGGIPLAIHILARLARATNLTSVLDNIEQLQIDIEDKREKLSIAFNYIYGEIWKNYLHATTKKMVTTQAPNVAQKAGY